jgi:predicted enzyme related to lactoylglutathione lyase
MMHGMICYVELALVNIKETLDFYQRYFGFQFEESFLSQQRYIMFKTPHQGILGAFDANHKPSLEGTLIYIETNDIDSLLMTMKQDFPKTQILKPKTFISKEFGCYALIVDPSGNRIGLQENPKDGL